MEDHLKNNAVSISEEIKIEDGFFILKFQNDTSDTKLMTRAIDNSFIQFHFNVKGGANFFSTMVITNCHYPKKTPCCCIILKEIFL